MKIHAFILAGTLAALMPPARAADAPAAPLPAPAQTAAEKQPPVVITLGDALARALRTAPGLLAAHSRGQAAAAHAEQAGAAPNPSVSLDLDNAMGNGAYEGWDAAEITLGVSQTVEMPGKRSGRVGVAQAQQTQSHFAADGARLDVIRDVTIAYAEAAAAQEEVAILSDDAQRARDVLDSVAAKVKAGKEPPIQENKASIEHAAARIALDRAERTLETKRAALESLTGGAHGDFTLDARSLPAPAMPELFETYRAGLRDTPDMKSMAAMVVQAQSALSLERAGAVPDPTFHLGVKDLRGDDAQALVAGISFPIPVFDSNRGNIRRAGHALNAAMLDERGARLSLQALLREVYGALSSAYADIEALRETVMPGAEENFRIARTGYAAGKFAFIDVLDAQRTLFEARRQFNAATLDYHRQRAILERLAATHDARHTHAQGTDHDKQKN